MNKDPNYVPALEKAIAEKYGEDTIANPRSFWNEEKEKKYLLETREKLKTEAKIEESRNHLDLNGVLIPEKLLNSNNKRKCEYCNTYSFNRIDNLYFTKYDTCRKCYVKYIEDREERWKQGWRPSKATEQK
jgi:hypothetical protein